MILLSPMSQVLALVIYLIFCLHVIISMGFTCYEQNLNLSHAFSPDACKTTATCVDGSVTLAHLLPHISGRGLTLPPFMQEKTSSKQWENAPPPFFISISESKPSAWINIREVSLLWLSLVSIRYVAEHGHVIVGKRGAQLFQQLLVPLRGKGLLLANCQVAGWAE